MNNVPIALVLDTEQLFSNAFSCMLEKYTSFTSSISFHHSQNLIDFLLTSRHSNCYVFLEYYLGESNGLAIANEIRRISRITKIIFVTKSKDQHVLLTIKSFLCNAIVSKYSRMESILQCMHALKEDKFYTCPTISSLLNKNVSPNPILFTARELEVMVYFSKGYTIDKTAETLFLSRNTIISHRRNMMKKANCSSMTQLITIAKEMKVI